MSKLTKNPKDVVTEALKENFTKGTKVSLKKQSERDFIHPSAYEKKDVQILDNAKDLVVTNFDTGLLGIQITSNSMNKSAWVPKQWLVKNL